MSLQLPDFSHLKIMVIGDVMIDRYLSGTVSRVSPEAPVPVIRLEREENRLGGAANVVLNLQALGVTPEVVSVVGADDNGRVFSSLLKDRGLSERGLIISDQRQTTVKTRVVAQNQQLLRADREDTFDLSEKENDNLRIAVKKILEEEKTDLIIFQDYNKGVLSLAIIEAMLEMARNLNIPTIVDPKDHNFWAYRGVDLFKPNLREIQAQLDFKIDPTLECLDRANNIIKEKLNHRATMITLAEHGVYINDGEKSAIYPTLPRQIRDVSGAGDSVISVAGAGMAAGMELEQLAILANLAGGQVIEKPGVVAVNLEQLRAEYHGI
ncbi:carbohydrate kinase [Lewinellaceae bacterium SD302]|nr:carbohydrate kinase [Lewinellaceae bacterium SD302]